MAKLCPRGKAAAKRKFKVYPSAYANMYASAVCSGKVTPGGKKKRKKAMGGGMMDRTKFDKGGGADTGTIGELKSKLSVLSNQVGRDIKRINKRIGKGSRSESPKPKTKPGEQKEMTPLAKGGRAEYRMGGKCKLAMKGKGRAYGKNS